MSFRMSSMRGPIVRAGTVRLVRTAVSCAVLLLWSGLSTTAANRTELVAVELLPKETTLRGANASQQLLVLGRFADWQQEGSDI